MEGPPLGPGGEDITWPDQVAPRGRKASSTRKIKPQTSNLGDYGLDISGLAAHPTAFRYFAGTVGVRVDYLVPCWCGLPSQQVIGTGESNNNKET